MLPGWCGLACLGFARSTGSLACSSSAYLAHMAKAKSNMRQGIYRRLEQLVIGADQVGNLGQDAALFLALGQLQGLRNRC